MADTSRHHNPWAADIYTRARARGASHQHAIWSGPRFADM
jgi:hypothetical protein